ncbi:MAG: type II secretion system F family protein [Proteobacteria bacterium]|nr:type II secretion system F family protein [Pseudomonadota bacterium]
MAKYRYKAVDKTSSTFEGVITAKNENEIQNVLREQGLLLVDIKKVNNIDFFGIKRIRLEHLFEFTYYLQLFFTSGLSLVTGLLSLSNQKNKYISYMSEIVYKDVCSGLSLSSSMEKHKEIFPEFYMQMIKAGEKAGNLDKVFNDLMDYINWQIDLKKTIRNALFYPIMILTAVMGLIAVLFVFVVPKLQKVLISLNVELPLPTKIVMGLGTFFKSYFLIFCIILFFLFVLLKGFSKTKEGKFIIDAILVKIPLISEFVKKINYSRYFKTVSTLFSSGLNVEQTFNTSASVVTNSFISEKMHEITDSILRGETISKAMMRTGIFPDFVLQMVSVGEKTGNFEDVSKKISEVFDKEVKDSVKKIFAFIEPIIIMLLGVVVLMVMLSVFLPIYKMLGGIRGR